MFTPIAIVGRGCVLPDALTPQDLWQNIVTRRVSLGPAPAGRWRLDARTVLSPNRQSRGEDEGGEHVWPDVGGYVRDFPAVLDPRGLQVEPRRLTTLDPLFHWTTYCGREALREAGLTGPHPGAGLVLGNLGYPASGMARFAEHVWTRALPPDLRARLDGEDVPDPRNRFSWGLAAHLTAEALGLGAGSVGLDAACASSLYAVKLAADRLHDGSADLMLAAAVNRPDDLFIHFGFGALRALSPSGRSRPFHRRADGLVPAEGAAAVALMRLDDAIRADTPILAVIRGIGLSNDGRGEGLLTPAEEGQVRAMRQAYESAEVAPESVSLVECHATGTPVGDTVEIRSMTRVFTDSRDLPVGSVKSNIGHPITAAGLAGLLKVLGSMEAGVRPATLGADELAEDLKNTPLRPLREAEPWEGPRRAAVSTFGFGGNNAHLVVDAWPPRDPSGLRTRVRQGSRASERAESADPVAIVAIGARVGTGEDTQALVDALLSGRAQDHRRESVRVRLAGLPFPPHDLKHAHAQQLLMLEAADDVLAGRRLSRERTMVLIGMGCDPEVARYGARWRAATWAAGAGLGEDQARTEALRNAFAPPLTAADVVGAMPNLVANRVNARFDLAGPGFTVFAEEASGIAALRLARRALLSGEADAVLVGAVDLSCEPVHQAAVRHLDRDRPPGDAAVALLLRRESAARRDGDEVIAVLDDPPEGGEPGLRVGAAAGPGRGPHYDPVDLFGSAHAAEGLVAVAVAALSLRHRAAPRPHGPAGPLLGEPTAEATVTPLGAPPLSVRLRARAPASWFAESPPRPHFYGGRDRREVIARVEAGQQSLAGPCRLALLSGSDDPLDDRRAAAARWLRDERPRPPRTFFRERPLTGDVAFVYTNGSASYAGQGRSLMLGMPCLLDELHERYGPVGELTGWTSTGRAPRAVEQIWAATILADAHTHLTRGVLGIHPSAAIGYSSGESAALLALGAWRDVPAVVDAVRRSALFTDEVCGEMRAVRRAWREQGVEDDRWTTFVVAAPAELVAGLVAEEPAVYLMVRAGPGTCVVGGAAQGCDRVLGRLDPSIPVVPVGYGIAAHAPVLDGVRKAWRRLHHWPVHAPPGVRFYSGATGRAYPLTSDSAAEALTAQALGTVDFAGTIRQAWEDGVRVFVEHGPNDLCSRWIASTLRDREHLAVAMDIAGQDDFAVLAETVAELAVAGVPVDTTALEAHMRDRPVVLGDDRHVVTLPAHPPPVVFPALPRSPGPAAPDAADLAGPAAPRRGSPSRLRHLAAGQRDFVRHQSETYLRFLGVQGRARRLLTSGTQPPDGVPARFAGTAGDSFPGPSFTRGQLETLATGDVAALFGPSFAALAERQRRTRLPTPPLLLIDRVLGIDAEPSTLKGGTIWTETDVADDAWYVDDEGRMPAGLLVEAGQADLLLLSWLGADLHAGPERVYRLLGCDLTFHGDLPEAGRRLRYEIGVDGHGEHDDVRLFFFHSRCRSDGRPLLTVSNGQAGYFTDEELAGTRGVVWEPEDGSPGGAAPPAAPVVPVGRRGFDETEVRAFAEGRPAECFGDRWRATRAHVHPPRPAGGRLALLRSVPVFDPQGGPWKRGYLRATLPISGSEWFFQGHFTNDPCMPGTLMFEGCLEAMAFYLAALGFTIERDGWRFAPVPEETYRLRCRGQVTPRSRSLVYEVFVAQVLAGPEPTLYADVLCTVDGVKAFHAHRLGLRLVPDWPLAYRSRLTEPAGPGTADASREQPGSPAARRDPRAASGPGGFAYDHRSILALAWGRPGDAFGPSHEPFDHPGRMPRLPGPPYLFVTRVTDVDIPPDGPGEGSSAVTEYDVPDDAWYWEQNGWPTMPVAVLMEVVLQSCGWLAFFAGDASANPRGLLFRNLGGTGTVTGEVTPACERLRTQVRLTGLSRDGDITVMSFRTDCNAGDVPVYTGTTMFGFFPVESFAAQVGLPRTGEERAALSEPGDYLLDLRDRPARFFQGTARLPGRMLLMLDRVTGLWPYGGSAGLGRLRAEKEVDPADWYFRAHFYQDPVQPGSLGVEAMCQLLQFYMLERGMHAGLLEPRFEPVCVGRPMGWKYRGQVTPMARHVVVELEITQAASEPGARRAVADGWLWVDGLCIYHVQDLGMRIVSGHAGTIRGDREES
ncbi:beta-ketoacyl synthase N-terminal-like domain-containing protein [Nonomuraea sp. NPDC003560]|uniref:beta-ketoacyl synthase N-terminal-like domain-containing protein n=1 Tax=Nonomuraea sp. NPDC003560 TaxID=3364341 RepID=UPI0036C80335